MSDHPAPDPAPDRATEIARLGSLAEPSRRALYLYVVEQADAVSRDQAAEAVGVPWHSAKFHLDRLVEDGLLDVEYRRLSGRTGPGAGRPAKLYRRSDRELRVALPERRYEAVGDVLATAVDSALREGTPMTEALQAAAEQRGRELAGTQRAAADAGGREDSGDRSVARLLAVLAREGYEPLLEEPDRRAVRLRNCPLDQLARKHTELVCGVNLTLLTAVVDEIGVPGAVAELAPHVGQCCVRIRLDA
jgi:predicted ArsR family transcriptional regulator